MKRARATNERDVNARREQNDFGGGTSRRLAASLASLPLTSRPRAREDAYVRHVPRARVFRARRARVSRKRRDEGGG